MGVAADVVCIITIGCHVVLARSVTSILAAPAVERVGHDECGRTADYPA